MRGYIYYVQWCYKVHAAASCSRPAIDIEQKIKLKTWTDRKRRPAHTTLHGRRMEGNKLGSK